MISFNTELALFYLAVGSVTELATMKYPTPGERAGTIAQVCGVSFVLGAVMPEAANGAVMLALFIAPMGKVLGRILGDGIDFFRLNRVMRSDGTTRGKQEESPGD